MPGNHKLHELFLMGKDGVKRILEPKKRYIMTKQGALRELLGAGLNNNDDKAFDEQIGNKNSLVLSGDRGDLRQIETVIRNMSSIYSNAVMKDDIFHSNEGQPDGEQSWAENTVLSFDEPRVISYLGVKHNTVIEEDIVITLQGSNDNSTWEDIQTIMVLGRAAAPFENTKVLPSATTYQYLRWSKSGEILPDSVFIGHTSVLYDRFLGAAEGDRLSELIGESYDLSVFIDGGIPSGEELISFKAPQRLTLKANFQNCVAKVITPPNSASGITLLKNDTPIGVITLNTNGAVTASYPETVFEEGDRLMLKAGDIADPLLSDVALTLVMARG
ncbi:hypothetical protein [Pseudoalteromonas umbrosa]|uniref:hypothetical protein n=1 Tax=Pseudoalteromonas umbrosa TaxID=3048489 RepID=UPI0024C3FB57|nr:hypothetical protein [Pseudoalteromonas sp. B95]MDK1290240.1 hypothetical protein [Pseudoalteromonas sp. B95]